MNIHIKNLLKNIVPRRLLIFISNSFQYKSFKGNFKNFDEVKSLVTNYDSNKIINKVLKAYKNSEKSSYLIDRDGEILKKKNQNFQLLNEMTHIINKSKFNCVIDYGGSLANFVRNNKNYLRKYNIVWIVIDNERICSLGKKIIKTDNIYFFDNLNKAYQFILKKNLIVNFFLFGSSIQYIQGFEKILKKIRLLNVRNIVIDRQPVLRNKTTKYAIQKIPFWVGNFSYAVKLYKSQSLINMFIKNGYFLVNRLNAFGDQFKDGEYKSFIFKQR
jgi:putative methyltransferase (TIGR04325 family)